jgi:hypothetical protein
MKRYLDDIQALLNEDVTKDSGNGQRNCNDLDQVSNLCPLPTNSSLVKVGE